MVKVELNQLIEAGAHFGHLTRRWNPKMKKYIFMEKNGIHIIDLKKTQKEIEKSSKALYDIIATGKKVLFVGTKKQAKPVVSAEAKACDMNWVSERWLGGMLTNFQTIRKSIKRLQNIDKMESDGTFDKITKKERLQLTREKDKLRKVLEGIETMTKLPGALFIVDIKKESIAVREAKRLNIPVFAIVDTNVDPNEVDYPIPANDDAVKTIGLVVKAMTKAVGEGAVKAKELRAHEAAEKERVKKEKIESGDDQKDGKRVRRFNKGGERKGGPRKPKADAPKQEAAPKKEEAKENKE
ncbi:MAG: 30S ribosomal protein S2 [Rhodothermaceae bacterium]